MVVSDKGDWAYNISYIITMIEKESIILPANKNMFGKYGVQLTQIPQKTRNL